MKAKKSLIPILIFIFSIIIGYVSGITSYVIKNNLQTTRLLSKDYTDDLFYNLHPTINNNQNQFVFSIYDDQMNFGFSDEINNKIRALNGIKNIYPYIALPFLNYYDAKGEVKESKITVDGKELILDKDLISQQIIIAPYYPDDPFDQNMEKIFISKDLSNLIQANNTSPINNISISNLRIPVSQNGEQVTYTDEKNDKHYYNTNQVNFIRAELTINNIETLNREYKSSLYNTSYAILLPYNKLFEIINQYKSFNEDAFVIPTQKIYYESSNVKELLNNIHNISDEIITSHLATEMKDNLIDFNKTFKNKFFLSISLLIFIFIINTIFYLKLKTIMAYDYFFIPLTMFICASITNYIIFSKFSLFSESIITIIILLLFFESLLLKYFRKNIQKI